jgi:hypothetical protein
LTSVDPTLHVVRDGVLPVGPLLAELALAVLDLRGDVVRGAVLVGAALPGGLGA